MWRLGDRELPRGIRFDGGSDWVALHRGFVQWVIQNRAHDPLLVGLEALFRHTLLPAESYFHTVRVLYTACVHLEARTHLPRQLLIV